MALLKAVAARATASKETREDAALAKKSYGFMLLMRYISRAFGAKNGHGAELMKAANSEGKDRKKEIERVVNKIIDTIVSLVEAGNKKHLSTMSATASASPNWFGTALANLLSEEQQKPLEFQYPFSSLAANAHMGILTAYFIRAMHEVLPHASDPKTKDFGYYLLTGDIDKLMDLLVRAGVAYTNILDKEWIPNKPRAERAAKADTKPAAAKTPARSPAKRKTAARRTGAVHQL